MNRPVRSASLSSRLTRRLHTGTERALEFVERKPRLLSAVLMSSLATCGATAFGVAPVSPEPALPPHRMIVEALALPGLARQREALEQHDAHWYRSTETRTGDTMASLFARLGVLDNAALAAAARDPQAKRLLDGRAGKRVRASTGEDGRLIELVARLPARETAQSATHFTRLTLREGPEGLQSLAETVPFGKGTRLASGTIRSTLFAATDAVDLPDNVAVQIADIFASEIDFHRELRRGDTFRIVYETPMADGEPATWTGGGGRVLAAEFVNKGRKREAVWYQNEQGRGQYFDFEGQSRRSAFLASPLEFSRVTSGFSMRMHPILKSWRQHLGIDYAAPSGTAVRTVGDGVVEFAGIQRGYGNVVIVKHSQQRSTLYAHLSHIDVAQGQGLNQGDRIGAVGSTGWSTGPHLHFEFKVAGEHQDPQTIAKAAETVALSARERKTFASLSQSYAHQLQVASTLADARTRGD
jgi:murein DD-endopeptidase MepM/ murein hydrolase activator NlpD